MPKFYRALINAESREDAREILTALLESKLVASGAITKEPSIFWWKGKIMEETCYSISAFTVAGNVEKIKKKVNKITKEEVPTMAFFEIDSGNKAFLDWISENTK